ncbi:hypothetical protein BSU01_01145 [Erwinia billingiae]|nr:hypothetical protein [Erwinia billingiae]
MIGLISALCSLAGSIILAFRVKKVIECIRMALSLHETSINQLIQCSKDRRYMGFTLIGANRPLENFLSKSGQWLLFLGFSLLGLGALLKIIEIAIQFYK